MFRGSEQVRAGRLTRAQLRSTAWRRLFPDEYACASLTIDHARRTRAAARLALPGAVVSGRSAGVLWGVDLAGPDDDVECTLAPECRAGSVRGIRVTRRALPTAEVTRRGGVPVTTVRRTALDLARIQPVDEAVVALDQFLRTELPSRGSPPPSPRPDTCECGFCEAHSRTNTHRDAVRARRVTRSTPGPGFPLLVGAFDDMSTRRRLDMTTVRL
jgi:hypothetical protein